MRSSLWQSNHLVSVTGALSPQSSTTANSSYAVNPSVSWGETLPTRDFFHQGLGKRSLCCLVTGKKTGNRALALLKALAADRFLQNLHLQENVRKLSLVRKSLKMLSFSLGSSLRLCSLHLSFHSGCWRRLQDIGHEPKPAELPRFPSKYNSIIL